jgi:chromosome segregation ATPase
MSSEARHGIMAQPANTCPMIDAAIEKIRTTVEDQVKILGDLVDTANAIKNSEDADELNRFVLEFLERVEAHPVSWKRHTCVQSALEDFPEEIRSDLDDIRAHVSEIREWGDDWKKHAKEWHEELETLRTTASDLQDELSEAKAEILCLENHVEELEAVAA